MKSIVEASDIGHQYDGQTVLSLETLNIPAGVMAGIIGPDGVGKSTLLALITGVKQLQQGSLKVLDGDIHARSFRKQLLSRVAYMPQGLGRNLYPTLSVSENLDFFGNLFGQSQQERQQRIEHLTRATGLFPFLDRPAGKLSGGMKQKLSLCCALIHDPDLLILDEPTTGVDPLSRQQFWQLIDSIRQQRPHMSVIVATAYMEEAEQFDWLAALDDGNLIATGSPQQLLQQTSSDNLEQAFIQLLPEAKRQQHQAVVVEPLTVFSDEAAIEAHNLTRRFGDFIAVNNVSFNIQKGEIFGFLGSNGCGKTTTMKMLTGLLPISSGDARLFGQQPDPKDLATRRKVGYMSQSFSLYSEISVRKNLELHASLYDLQGEQADNRIAELLTQYNLEQVADTLPASLPLGIRQRLQLAVAVLHKPEILILDEPTSGVDPVARDAFWRQLIDLSRNDGVTIFISTHFMNEAERCDRVSLMHAGEVLAVGEPQQLAQQRGFDSLEGAFVDYLSEASRSSEEVSLPSAESSEDAPAAIADTTSDATSDNTAGTVKEAITGLSLRRWWAYAQRETLEILRDPIRLAFSLFGPLFLMLTFGYGISFDVEDLKYAVLDNDHSLESRTLTASLSGSRYFQQHAELTTYQQGMDLIQQGKLTLFVEIPPGFGRDFLQGNHPGVNVTIDGAMPFKAETTAGYVTGLTLAELEKIMATSPYGKRDLLPLEIQSRFYFNQSFESVFAIVPGVVMLMLVLIPAMMTALGIVREKETGSIANFYSTPVTRLEFLCGKQAPYIAIAFISFITLLALAVLLFDVPVKGSLSALTAGAILYVWATTSFGLVISTFTKTQIAAMFASMVLSIIPAVNFSGLLTPVSSLSDSGQLIGISFPSSWFQQISIGTFTKSLGWPDLWLNHLMLAGFIVVFTSLAWFGLNKQER